MERGWVSENNGMTCRVLVEDLLLARLLLLCLTAKEEFCESGFECLPTASQKIPWEPETAAAATEALANASETSPPLTFSEPNVTAANNSSSKPSSLRGMHIGGGHIGHIGGFGHPGFHPAVHPRPFRPYHPIRPYYHPWRPYRPYVRPYWRYPRVWGSAITCPCGILAGFRWAPDSKDQWSS